MSAERRAVFHLVALGRMTSAEAERLLAIGSADRESRWMVAACAVMAIVATLHSVLPGAGSAVWQVLHQALGGMR